MKITARAGEAFGVTVEGLDAAEASSADLAMLKKAVYADKIAVLKGQDVTRDGILALGKRLGRRAEFHEPVYRSPGCFWHSDYLLTRAPFDFALAYPKVVPTYFIDMAAAYRRLSADLKLAVVGATATHSVLRHAKLLPADVRRPISELVQVVTGKAPPVTNSITEPHPRTGETVLHLSEGFTTSVQDAGGADRPDLLARLLEVTGQLDRTYQHDNVHLQTFEAGDLLVWDNRSLIHHASYTATPEPVVSVYDG
ncbi:TauD/TfdA dioxygenase family protein [Actinophytocola sp.]|uniref:TauD/TfdA dioxygenase family protein n=1 Tax=Actinophytocola sp. TaxID=1872138 RepID=UPI002ED245A8